MELLIAGLVIFLGTHSVRIFAEDWRTRQIARLGPYGWKGLYTLVSLAGFALIVWGYGLTRENPVVIWEPPIWTRHAAALLTIATFVLWVAAYVPGNRIKAAIGHPMIVGVKVWAFAHLISNGRLGDVVLFAAFLAWAVFDFRAARGRDRAAGTRYPVGPVSRDLTTVVVGLVAWWVFAAYLHGWLIGVRPFG
jgi:uncharacterized membrane protein